MRNKRQRETIHCSEAINKKRIFPKQKQQQTNTTLDNKGVPTQYVRRFVPFYSVWLSNYFAVYFGRWMICTQSAHYFDRVCENIFVQYIDRNEWKTMRCRIVKRWKEERVRYKKKSHLVRWVFFSLSLSLVNCGFFFSAFIHLFLRLRSIVVLPFCKKRNAIPLRLRLFVNQKSRLKMTMILNFRKNLHTISNARNRIQIQTNYFRIDDFEQCSAYG